MAALDGVQDYLKVFCDVRRVVAAKFPELEKVRMAICPEIARRRKAHRDPLERKRSFGHTGHVDATVCVHPKIFKLDLPFMIGLTFHEFGHLIAVPRGLTGQSDADGVIGQYFDVPIFYDGRLDLEWTPAEYLYG